MITREGVKEIECLQIIIGKRYLEPSEASIKAMAKSMSSPSGQLTPIIVNHVTRNSYQLVAGATRLRAAIDILDWRRIRAEIVQGDPLDYQIMELAENLDRRGLTGKQRKDMRIRRIQLERELLGKVELSKGGRGHKGGVRDAARQADIPRTTAQRRHKEVAQVGQFLTSPATPAPIALADNPAPAFKSATEQIALKKTSLLITVADYEALKARAAAQNQTLSELVRHVIREFLKGNT
jgi:ParB-like chromosome segregation protein Spo0J